VKILPAAVPMDLHLICQQKRILGSKSRLSRLA